jgi:sulfur-oxidizing protein SoxZ
MKKLILALSSVALMMTNVMAEAPATAGSSTKVKMKIKAKEKEGVVKAKVSIKHDMLTYDQAKKKGVEANFITHITGTVGDKVVYDASTSQFLSKNPLIKFQFSGKKGEELKITYTDLKGATFFDSKKIK